jgi:heme exporter protein C
MIENGKVWKFTGVGLLLYVILAGMFIPLKTGIESVVPAFAKAGEDLEMEVKGYNSHYREEGKSIRAWLKWENGQAITAKNITVKDDRTLRLTFSIPGNQPGNQEVNTVSLWLDHPIDGTSVLPSAIFITAAKEEPRSENEPWVIPGDFSRTTKITFPYRNILGETIRNTYFHVPLWFGMMFLFLFAVMQSIKYLKNKNPECDLKAAAFTQAGIFYGVMGLVTGALWAKNTWGAYWSWDIKQNMTVVALLIYAAYFILRASFEDPEKRGRVSAAYGIFAFSTLIPLLYVIPRLTDSLHPGSGGNPAFGSQDLDNTMRLVFYPAVMGWTLFGFWLGSLQFRFLKLKKMREDKD